MKFSVLFEQHVHKQVNVEADSYEDAVRLAHQAPPVVVADRMRATWVGSAEHLDREGEFEHCVVDNCFTCQAVLVGRDIEGQPWAYNTNDDGYLICYACWKK